MSALYLRPNKTRKPLFPQLVTITALKKLKIEEKYLRNFEVFGKSHRPKNVKEGPVKM